MADEAMNPEVSKTIADLSSVRVDSNAAENMPRHFWSALKNGHYRFAAGGIAISLPISLAIGAAFCAMAGVTGGLLPVALVAFAGTGAMMAVEVFGSIGSAAASRASGLAEKHARVLDADMQGKGTAAAMDDKLMANGRGNHYGPQNYEKGKVYHVGSGLAGGALAATLGAAVGTGLGVAAFAGHLTGLAGIATAMVDAPILGTLAAAIAPALPIAAPVIALAVAGAITFGLFGMTLGINRDVLKSAFNQTDANISGKLIFRNGPDLGRAQSLEPQDAFTRHRIRRQAEIDQLEKAYNDRIFWGGVTGHFKGFAAVAPGAVIGALAGAAALGGLALASVAAPAVIVPLFAAAGGMYAMKVAGESATEAGAEATARAIDNEFERNRALRARGITPPAPQEPRETFFSAKPALVCGLIGAAVGILLAPIVGVASLAIVTGASMASIGAFSGAAIAASMAMSGLIGATYGINIKAMKAAAKPALKLYDTITSPTHGGPSPEIAPVVQQQACPPVPACEQVTYEDMARISEKTAAQSNKSFAQSVTTQSMATTTASVGA